MDTEAKVGTSVSRGGPPIGKLSHKTSIKITVKGVKCVHTKKQLKTYLPNYTDQDIKRSAERGWKPRKFRIFIATEPNSRAVNMAPGPNATNYENIKELISPRSTCKEQKIWKGPGTSLFLSAIACHTALYETNFIKSFCKGQVGCVFSELLSYFVTQTEKLDNIHCISKDWNTLMSRCWFPVGWYQSFGQCSFTRCCANSKLTPSVPEYLQKPTLNCLHKKKPVTIQMDNDRAWC